MWMKYSLRCAHSIRSLYLYMAMKRGYARSSIYKQLLIGHPPFQGYLLTKKTPFLFRKIKEITREINFPWRPRSFWVDFRQTRGWVYLILTQVLNKCTRLINVHFCLQFCAKTLINLEEEEEASESFVTPKHFPLVYEECWLLSWKYGWGFSWEKEISEKHLHFDEQRLSGNLIKKFKLYPGKCLGSRVSYCPGMWTSQSHLRLHYQGYHWPQKILKAIYISSVQLRGKQALPITIKTTVFE